MPDQPSKPGRIIIPGAEPEPEASAPPKIVLPPGVVAEEDTSLPEYPRLRPLILLPFSDGQREMLLVNDPLGVINGQPVLSLESLPLIQMFDGTLSLNDITAAVMRESKDLRVANMVRDFVAQLDRLLMLESPRFEEAYRALREAYHPLEIRPAALEGRSYPADAPTLAPFLDAHFAEAEEMRTQAGEPVAAKDAAPRAILAPHLDPRRAGATTARALLELGAEPTEPLRIVVLGTGHQLMGDLFALTRKHFETPFGKLTTDTAFVDRVAARLGDEVAYHGELAHREEHSIEFQAVYLKHRFRDRPITIVPVLCGGFHSLLDEKKTPREDVGFEAFLEAMRDAEKSLGGRTVYLASVDFSHVGTRFGDPAVDDRTRSEVEAKDREAIEAARGGNADAWFTTIADHDDSTRICGFAPTYALLRCAEPGTGRLLHYARDEEKDGSFVSIAAMAWG